MNQTFYFSSDDLCFALLWHLQLNSYLWLVCTRRFCVCLYKCWGWGDYMVPFWGLADVKTVLKIIPNPHAKKRPFAGWSYEPQMAPHGEFRWFKVSSAAYFTASSSSLSAAWHVNVLNLQSSGAVWTGRWAWVLVTCPILPPSLISRTVSVDVKHHEGRRKLNLVQNTGSVRLCCLMSSDVGWRIRDKLRPVPKHGSINLYVHGNQKARGTGSPGRPPRLSHSSWNYDQNTGFFAKL